MKNSLFTAFLLLFICTACRKDIFDHDANVGLKENLENLLEAYTDLGLPGIVLLVDHPEQGEILIAKGFADLEKKTPLLSTHLFHSASVMKIFTAASIFQLEEIGVLAIQDEIDQYLSPELIKKIPNGNCIQIQQLLNHSSGIPDFANQKNYLDDFLNFVDGGQTPKNELEYIRDVKPSFAPGMGTEYSNTGYYILALVIEEITGASFANYISRHFIETLQLQNTYYKNEAAYPSPNGLPEYYIDWDDKGILELSSNVETHLISITNGINGLIASVADYHALLKALFKSEILLSATSLSKMKTVNHSKGFGYGKGLEVILSNKYPDKYGHKGGTQSSAFYYPDKEIFILVFINYSFNTGNSPFDRMALTPDKIGENKNLIGEIERCLFD